MKKSGLFVSIILLTLILACTQSNKTNTAEKPQNAINKNEDADPQPLSNVTLSVEKKDGVWKVINESMPGKTPTVKKNGKISWVSESTDLYIQFPEALLDPDTPEDSLKYGYIKHQKKGETLKLHVKDSDSVKTGTYYYAIFCMADSTFAQEDSPPKIIVED